MSKPNLTRREFLQRAGAAAGGMAVARYAGGAEPPPVSPAGREVRILLYPEDPIVESAPVQWAAGWLRATLESRGLQVRQERATATAASQGAGTTIGVAGAKAPAARSLLDSLPNRDLAARFNQVPESFAWLSPRTDTGLLTAVDALGLVYGLTELADRVRYATDQVAAFKEGAGQIESPANRIRGIFRMFTAEVEDKRWFYDREGWQKYFDLLVTNRFNRFNLSFGLAYDFSTNLSDTYTFFMYPFFVDVAGYKVRAIAKDGTPLPAEEQKKNLETLNFISEQAALRGLQFNLGIWTHNYRWTTSPNATFTIEGLDAQTQAPYSRDAMKMLIDTCPGITGITLRTHGESGVPEGSYDLWKIIMSGAVGHKNADGSARVVELDLHGKTMTKEMIDTALSTGMPVTISCKFWAEHMGLPYVQSSIRESEMPRGRDASGLMALSSGTRSFLRYGVGDLLATDRKYKVIHRFWPGTQRVLLSGDPLFAAENGRAGAFAGMDGIEYFEPMGFKGRAGSSMGIPLAPDRSGYADASLRSERDWEKYAYSFRLWGRLSYNPAATAQQWQRFLKTEFEQSAEPAEKALASASRMLPLITTAHLPAASNAAYWPEIYVNMSLYDTTKVGSYGEAPNPKVFGNVSSLDPQMFASVNEYVDALLANKPLAKVTPIVVAQQLDAWAMEAQAALTSIKGTSPAVRRAAIDATIEVGIGQFFAHKFRAAALWQLFNLTGHQPARAAAVTSYKQARESWAALADTAKVYLPDITYGNGRHMRRHWAERLADIDTDITGIGAGAAQRSSSSYAPSDIETAIKKVLEPVANSPRLIHTPPAKARAGEALSLSLGASPESGIDSARLWYRHLNQGDRWQVIDMKAGQREFGAAIPAAYVTGAFPLQYYFEVRAKQLAAMCPGFGKNFTGTPYYLVMPA
jgi:hypothetical protein